jgi:hypothetical protein
VTDNVDQNLGYKAFLNGKLVSNIVIGTSAATTDTIDYLAADTAGNTPTFSKTKLFVCAPEFPIPFAVARAGQPTRQLAGRPGCEEKTPPKRGLDRSVAINGHPDRACQGLVSDPVSVSGAVGSLLSPR